MNSKAKINFIENYLMIPNKEGMTVPFIPNKVQRFFLENRTHRDIIVKARQLGLSSIILADMFVDAITAPNMVCVVVSHEQHAAERLLAKIHFFYDTLRTPIKPEMGHRSATEISFPNHNSSIYVGTSRSMTFGRGDLIHKFHGSELGWYEDGERIVNAIEEAVPLGGSAIWESTPHGEGNILFDMWSKAREGKNSYKPFFFPWWFEDNYSLPRGSEHALPEDIGKLTLGAEELELQKKFHLTENQIRWRRMKLGNKGGLFYQEYPEDEIGCFITVGDPVFDPLRLDVLSKQCYPGKMEDDWMI